MRFINNIKHKDQEKLQIKKGGGEQLMFGNELIIGGIRAQSEHLKRILTQLESDEHWKNNSHYYAKEISDLEKSLRMIRKKDFESINKCGVCEAYGIKQ
jgi:hypothetical protein